MSTSFLKRVQRRLMPSKKAAITPGEQEADYYDSVYSVSEEYRVPYLKSRYYFVWTVIVDRIRRHHSQGVLEIGCGSGQLAEMLRSYIDVPYTGLDFSAKAIGLAQQRAISNASFVVDDARTSSVYQNTLYDTLLCTEVLEHIEEDLTVIQNIPQGKYCVCTVPDFPYTSHVRHFVNTQTVIDRYGMFFENFDVYQLYRPEAKGSYYLFDGIRNQK